MHFHNNEPQSPKNYVVLTTTIIMHMVCMFCLQIFSGASCPPLPPPLLELDCCLSSSATYLNTNISSSCKEEYFLSTSSLLISHSLDVLENWSEYNVTIDHFNDELFWAGLTAFFKGAISNPKKFKKLIVTLTGTGEIGSDCGSLRNDFFEDGLRLVH